MYMKRAFLILCIALATTMAVHSKTIDEIIAGLTGMPGSTAIIEYSVTLPMSDDDIKYNVRLESINDPTDTLCGYKYYASYSNAADGEKGFMSYFSGSYYRYDNERLKEYHWEWDSIPMMTRYLNGKTIYGIQKSGLFQPLVPNQIGFTLAGMMKDSNNKIRFVPDTVFKGIKSDVIIVYETIKGEVFRESAYAFDRDTGAPVYITHDNNPGSLGEQFVTVRYADFKPESTDSINEARLMRDYPAVFEKYRVLNFKIENLPGRKLPEFSLPTTTGERYTWDGGFKAPTIIVFLKSRAGVTPETIKKIRQARDESPMTADIIWVFAENNRDDIEYVMPRNCFGEYVLMSGNKFAGDCGVTGFPTVLFVNNNGIVKDVQLGYNKDIKNIVIQKMALIKN